MIKNVLPEIPVFENLDRDQIDELSSWLQRKDIDKGKIIINEGERSDGLYVLARGEVEVSKRTAGGPLVIAELEAPSVIGEMGLLNEESRSAQVSSSGLMVVAPIVARIGRMDLRTAVKNAALAFSMRCQRSATWMAAGRAFEVASPYPPPRSRDTIFMAGWLANHA